MRTVRRAPEFGIHVAGASVDFARIMARKDEVVGRSVENEAFLGMLQEHSIPLFKDHAAFLDPHRLQVNGQTLTADRVIVATGTTPAVPPVEGLRETGYISSDEAMEMKALPESIVIIGAGAVGLEFAEFFAPLGCRVTVLEMLDRVLPQEDEEISDALQQYMEADGVDIHTRAKVVRVTRNGADKVVVAETADGTRTFTGREILVATGRRPTTAGLGLEQAGVEVGRAGVIVDRELRTSQEHILAAGDVVGGYLFTHKAVYEGEIATHNALSSVALEADYTAVPRVTFTEPQVGSVGLTERQAREAGHDVRAVKVYLKDMGKGPAIGETRGFVKLVADNKTGRLLGWHVVSHLANEIIMEGVIAIQAGLTVMDIAGAIHPHPTISEMVRAAAKTLVEGPGRLACC
ncbi:MAG: NAD(P)/FAD-dependent oxidoreductase, partial [Armatimonadetes bacterium]|nr:NAD(P)/FAD-dependent oxidoreductase [Armatimonadota bacterium]